VRRSAACPRAAAQRAKIDRTEIASETEAQLFADARKIVWGRYAR